tara:strand:+ start:590 stop:2326 length:1737 start_codon:yes stop_codon:yes gene_type:complete
MSYHNTSTPVARSITNAQGQAAPAGYHYMPDGSLMLDSAHVNYTAAKVIKSFYLDTSNVKAEGEVRTLKISGDNGALFSLEIRNGANYYNFKTNLFQTTQTKLSNASILTGSYNKEIKFPLVAAGAQYDIYLTTGSGTKHSQYVEARFSDGSIDINSTTGSNSNIIQRVIYQTLDVTMTVQGYSPNGTVTGANTTSATITTSRGASVGEIAFNHTFTVTSTRTLSIIKQPSTKDVMAFITATVGTTPVDIPGEDIYPTVSAAGSINVAVSSSTNVTVDSLTATPLVGDSFEIIDAPNSSSPQIVTAVGSGNITSSVAISADNDKRIEFRNQRNHRWPISSTAFDVSKITPGMQQIKGTFFESVATVKGYLEQITELEGTANARTIDKVKIPAIQTLGIKPLAVRDPTTKVLTTTVGAASNPINITFDKQALKAFGGGANATIFGYGNSEINRLTGYDVEFSDLSVTLAEVSTTTTGAVSASTSVPVAQRAGIMNLISSVSGVGINPSVAAPTVASAAGSVTGAGTIVLSAAQTLESGVTLTFPGAGTVATISGNIKVNNVGNENVTLRFDLEKFLTMH